MAPPIPESHGGAGVMTPVCSLFEGARGASMPCGELIRTALVATSDERPVELGQTRTATKDCPMLP